MPAGGVNNSLKYFIFGCYRYTCPRCSYAKDYEAGDRGEECPKCKQRKNGKQTVLLVSEKVDGLGLTTDKRTDSGALSMDKEVIEDWEMTLPANSKPLLFIKNLGAKRKRDTAVSYMNAYERFWVPLGVSLWYRLHPSLNPTGTTTLRWSSSNPNEQNISKKEDFNIRSCFGPAPGREWWSMDGKNLELRIPAYEANEREMIALFERPDEAPYYGSNHLLNFHTVYENLWNKELAEVGFDKVGPHCKKKYASTWYQWCKNGGFAKQYGGQAPRWTPRSIDREPMICWSIGSRVSLPSTRLA